METAYQVLDAAASNPEATMTAVQVGTWAWLGRSMKYMVEEPSETYQREARSYSNEELVDKLFDTRDDFRFRETGSEIEGSSYEFFALFDGMFRPRRAQRRTALVDEARTRGLRFDEDGVIQDADYTSSDRIDEELEQGESQGLPEAEVDQRVDEIWDEVKN